MKELQEYDLSLKSLQIGSYDYVYSLDNAFFDLIEAPDIKRGAVEARVNVVKTAHSIELSFHLEGKVFCICDRCLDNLEIPIVSDERLFVKFGMEYAEESADMIIISESLGIYNIAWIMYEFIVLAIPICRQHEEGECNEEMMGLFSKYAVGVKNDDDLVDGELNELAKKDKNKEVDPRWAALKNIFDNN